MKKLFIIFIVLLSFSLVLVGCSNDNEVDENDGEVEEDVIGDDNDPDADEKEDTSDIGSILSKSNDIKEYYYEYGISACTPLPDMPYS